MCYNGVNRMLPFTGLAPLTALLANEAKSYMNYITIPLSKTGKHVGKYEAIVSIEDADLAELNWIVVNNKSKTQYASRRIGLISVKMHRVILARKLERESLLPTEYVDHIDGNGLNNCRDNLRLATKSQNQHNRTRYNNNTSGYKGVYWHKRVGKWIARININRKRINLGVFDTPELAYAAYCQAAKELHGEFANFDTTSVTVEREGE